MGSSAGGCFLPGDPPPTTAPFNALGVPLAITATGATGTTAYQLASGTSAFFMTATGTSGAGVNLPVPVAGQWGIVTNLMTGICKIYSVGATINGSTGTTAISLDVTGNCTVLASCATAGAWQVRLNT